VIGIISLAVLIGLLMSLFFPEKKKGNNLDVTAALPDTIRTKKLWVLIVFFGLLLAIMILTTDRSYIASLVLFLVLVVFLPFTFTKDDMIEWAKATWQFIRSIIPWLIVGSLGAGLVSILLPEIIVSEYVGGNSLFSCFIASVIGSLLYFCSLAQVPFIRALLDLGMGRGPALAIELTGAAISLPSMLVLLRIMGTKRTLTYIGLVVTFASVAAYIFGLAVG